VRKFPILHNRVISGGKAADISNKNYDIAIARFKIDKISIMELNMAMENRDRSNREYLQALRDFWLAYYEIRMLTLYDFRQGTKLKH
jgi:outer membrane protein